MKCHINHIGIHKLYFLAGIYIHIPFCRQACYYCNFHFSTSRSSKDEMIKALVNEIGLRIGSVQDVPTAILSSPSEIIETIYFGGGTPSLLSKNEVSLLLSSIVKRYNVHPQAEITLEANPDDINAEKLREWKAAGINRLSIGIQSFVERDLVWMNRAHNVQQALDCMPLARAAGFDNFSIDLIFGIPHLTNEEWTKNVQTAIDRNVPHIACYALTVEPKTSLQKMIALKKKEDINTDVQAVQYELLVKMMGDSGYVHYEISNFGKPGFRSRHNSSYWQGKKYIGIGPSAHSYNGNMRMWNKANNAVYINSIQKNIIPFEQEILTPSQKMNEYVMTSLRTIEGLDLQFIEENFSVADRKRIESLVEREVGEEMFFTREGKIILTARGKLFADGIAVKLFT